MSKKSGPKAISDEAQAAAQAKVAEAYRRQILDDLKFFMENRQGRRFIARLIFDQCGVIYSQPWNPSADIHRQAGRREIGEQLLKDIEMLLPHSARTMVSEWFADRNERNAAVALVPRAEETDDGDRD